MSVDSLRYKPGVRTSLNSGNSIRANFSSGSKTSEVKQTRNSTASSAAANLQTMSRATGSWNSSTGSILNGNAPTRSANSRSSSGTTVSNNSTSSTNSSGTTTRTSNSRNAARTSTRQGTVRSENYVGSNWGQNSYVRDKYSTQLDLGYTRAENTTGYGGRAFQRMQDKVYGQGAYAVEQTSHSHKLSTWEKLGLGLVGGATVGAALWNIFSSKSDSVSGTSEKGSVSGDAKTNINNMKSKANGDPEPFRAAINVAKNDRETVNSSITTMETQLKEAEGKKDTLAADLKTKKDAVETLNKGIGDLKTSINALQSQIDKKKSDNTDTTELEKQLEEKQQELKEKKDELRTAEHEVKTAQADVDANTKIIDETPAKIKDAKATVESYDSEIPKYEEILKKHDAQVTSTINELEAKKTKLDNEVQEATTNGKDNKARKKQEKAFAVEGALNQCYEQQEIKNMHDVTTSYANGHEYKVGTDSQGQTMYVVDGKKVTEDEFKAQGGTVETA